MVPTTLLAPILQRWMRMNEANQKDLAAASKVSERTLYSILSPNSTVQYTNWSTVDKILVNLDMVEEWHCSLSDYFCPAAA